MASKKDHTPFEEGRLAGKFDAALDVTVGVKPVVQKQTAVPLLDPVVERMLYDKGINPKNS